MMRKILMPLRLRYWWFSKIPPLVAICCLMAFGFGLSPKEALLLILTLLVIFFCIFSYGYSINDIFDIKEDRLAGKSNRMEQFPPAVRYAYLVVPVLICGAYFVFFQHNLLIIIVCACNFFIVTLYSVPPVRLKDHALAGVIADAIGAHILPTLFVILISTEKGFPVTRAASFLPYAALIWSVCIGFRGIIQHQILDYDHDGTAGVRTLPYLTGRPALKKLILGFCFPLEMLFFLIMVVIIFPQTPVPLIFLAFYMILELAKRRLDWKLTCFHPENPNSEGYIPFINNQYNEAWWPLSLAIPLAFTGRWGMVILILVLVLFFSNILRNAKMNAGLFVDIFRRFWSYLRKQKS